MIVFILLLCIAVEYRFSPRMEYLKESSVLVFYYFARKNMRKRIIFKL